MRAADHATASIGICVKRGDGAAERLAAILEIGELVERRAGRREEHRRLGTAVERGVLRRHPDGSLKIAGDHVRHLAGKHGGKLVRRLADQIGLGDARERIP